MTQNEDLPPRSEKRRKTGVIAYRVKPEDLARLERAAAKDGYDKPTDWARDVALGLAGGAGRDHRMLPGLVRELRGIGLALDRLAKVDASPDANGIAIDLPDTMAKVTELMGRIGRALP